MKKLIYFIVILNLIQNLSKGQNLVPNYSFETYTACPNTLDQIYFANSWFQPSIHFGNTTNSSSSDLYNGCSSISATRIPSNTLGFQYARTNNAYAGILTSYHDTINYREYIEVPLDTSLIANNSYCVELYVSLSNGSKRAVSNMGAYFSVDSLLDTTLRHAIDLVIPQVENSVSNMLNDTANWMLVSGSFVATGGEKFMTIGNFHLPANTNQQVVSTVGQNFAYYYIDDVSVVDCTGVGVSEVSKKNNFKLYPNPSNGNISVEYNIQDTDNAVINIYNMAGSLINTYHVNSKKSFLNINETELAAGIYYYNIRVNEKIFETNKIVIIK